MKDIQITIAGKIGTGKSHLIALIKKVLQENNFNVDLDSTVIKDYGTEVKFDQETLKNLNKALNSISGQTNITIKEVQLARASQ